MIITLEPNQKIEIRFAHSRDGNGEPQTTDGIITVDHDDRAKTIRVIASERDSNGRSRTIYKEAYGALPEADGARSPSGELSESEAAIFRRVSNLTSEHLGVPLEEINPASDFMDDLGADSLDQVELVMAFEEEFGLEIPDEDADGILTVYQAVTYLARAIS
ncbi:acyl carrier protein [Agrobacterium rubi]|nr:acyl carrier protein [Agrobacterium rubi]NTF24181.1 acyl carrier protein [Agrobacterium rubi]